LGTTAVRGEKIEEHIVTDLYLYNQENRPSLTSSAVAEHQDVSLKNTIDEIAEAITGSNDVSFWFLWPVHIPKKCGNIG